MICPHCKQKIEAGYFGTFSREALCEKCYSKQAKETIQEACLPMGDTNPVATQGVTLDKVESAVIENLK